MSWTYEIVGNELVVKKDNVLYVRTSLVDAESQLAKHKLVDELWESLQELLGSVYEV